MIKPWLLLLPLLFFNVVVILAPSLGTIYYAFTDWSGLGDAQWTGLANFQRLLGDTIFWRAFGNNLIWCILFLTVPIGMALLGASLLANIRRGQTFFRVLYFAPYVIASVVVTALWRNIFNPSMGIGVQLAKLGLLWADIKFLGDSNIVLYSVAFIDNWHWWGFLLVIYFAAMQSVDYSLYEHARLEGANRWQEFIHITLPGIRPTLVFTLLITVIFSFLAFEYVWLLTQGGPANASEMLSTMAYKSAFRRFEAGYAAAIGLTTSVICLVFGTLFVALRRRGWEI
ncbi:MAG: sugar ABC transporter permease [Anaerolineae bacterium]|nr:sugar ABC transporter permease [Candidatus Roseilinea sp.]MDW8449309.1 sugar ABC transporter permease [Anaerolineae bacterium]